MNPAEHHRFCENCGAALASGLRFCEQCGAPVDLVAPQALSASEVASKPEPTSARRSSLAVVIGVAISVVVLLMAGAGAWWWLLQTKGRSTGAADAVPSNVSTNAGVSVLPTPSAPDPISAQPVQKVSGVFPAQPFNGMQMEYQLEGVRVDGSKDEDGFTTSRTLTGVPVGGSLHVSGRIGMGSGNRAEAHVRLRSGSSQRDLPLNVTAGGGAMNWRTFDVSVPITAGRAELTIEMIGTYNVAQRRLLLTGHFGAAEGNTTNPSHPRNPEVAAAEDLADMVLWWSQQPWVKALQKSMPPGVKVLMHADPYDAEGWSDVTLREEHAPASGFDPNVSPTIGIFRVSRIGRKVEWMEPVSGEYQPLQEFIKARGLKVTGGPTAFGTAPVGGIGLIGLRARNLNEECGVATCAAVVCSAGHLPQKEVLLPMPPSLNVQRSQDDLRDLNLSCERSWP